MKAETHRKGSSPCTGAFRVRTGIEEVLGQGSCHVLSVRNEGGIRVQ